MKKRIVITESELKNLIKQKLNEMGFKKSYSLENYSPMQISVFMALLHGDEMLYRDIVERLPQDALRLIYSMAKGNGFNVDDGNEWVEPKRNNLMY